MLKKLRQNVSNLKKSKNVVQVKLTCDVIHVV